MPGIKAVVLLGGPSRGTRFRPLSLNTPKPLFPVANEPFLLHHLRACARIPELKEVLLIGFYADGLFEEFIKQAESELHITVRYLCEPKALGTGGGLHRFRDQIMAGNPDHFFVLHVDIYGDFQMENMLKAHVARGPAGAVTMLAKKVSRSLANNFGCLVANADGMVLHYAEKPETFVSDLINCGVYLFSPSIFEQLAAAIKSNASNRQFDRDPECISLESDVLARLAGSGRLFALITEGAWGQVKNAASALPANALYMEMYRKQDPGRLAVNKEGGPTIVGNVIIHPTAKVHPTAKLGPNVTIGPNVAIGEGVRIKDAMVLEGADIRQHACILNAIIGARNYIGSWTRIEGSETPTFEQAVNERANDRRIGILGDDVSVADEIIVRNCVVLPFKELKCNYHHEIIM